MSYRSHPNRRNLTRLARHRLSASILDWVAFGLAGLLAFELRFDFALPHNYLLPMEAALCVWIVVKPIAFIFAKLNRGNWRYTSVHDAVRVFGTNAVGSILCGLVILALLGPFGIPRSIYILDWILSCMLTFGMRVLARVIVLNYGFQQSEEGDRTRTLIYGAGSAGLALLLELYQNRSHRLDLVGLIDDDPSKRHLVLLGKPVLGTGEELAPLVRKHDIKKVLIAVPSATGAEMVRILKFAFDAGVEFKMVPGLGDLLDGKELGKQIRDVAVEDLLGRRPVRLDQAGIRERIQGKVVMVTGAGGSIGSEICRQIARFGPLALIGFDEAETPLFLIDAELRKTFPHLVFHPEIGNIREPETLRLVMQRHRPNVLYHAAAYKHVPMMERHVFAAVENNIFGTWQVAQAAIDHGVEDFVMISTDKAVRPTSVMGATKRMAELVICALQRESRTKFVSVRFGNVLGSNGSVVPIFKEQIAAGGPVTVTHPEVTRYFMTIPEASQLVLQAFAMGKGGEVFVLDMGDPVKIVDLARNLILLSGLQPEKHIRIEFTGLRSGEKLFEELNLHDEHLVATSHVKIRSFVRPVQLDQVRLRACLRELENISRARDLGRLLTLFKEMIPDYNPGALVLSKALSRNGTHPELDANVVPVAQRQFGEVSRPKLPEKKMPPRLFGAESGLEYP